MPRAASSAGTPGYYEQADSIDGRDIFVTRFNSWRGYADPGTVFGPAFASELGNLMLFGLVVNRNGSQFSISQLGFWAFITSPGDALGFSFGAGSYNYGNGYFGVLAWLDGILFTSDAVLITGGPNTQLVDALVGAAAAATRSSPAAPATPRAEATPSANSSSTTWRATTTVSSISSRAPTI